MRRFRFRLGSLLRLRSQFERAARGTLAVATGDVAAVEQRLLATAESLRQCEEHGRGAGAPAQLARALEQGLARYRLRLQRERSAATARLDRARSDWLDRRREQRTLEMLHERQRALWDDTQQRREQHELEELARLRAKPRATATDGGTA
jgi:flagellar export protein FliJ